MSWQTFKDNLVSFGNNPDNISDIDKVAKKWADEYDAAIKRGGDTINKIKIQNGNKEIMEQLFKAALQKGLSSTGPYDLVGEMGNGVIAYWSGAIMQNVPIPIQLPKGATANVSITSNVVLNPGQWTPPIPAPSQIVYDEVLSELDMANNIDTAMVEIGASDKPSTEEEITALANELYPDLQQQVDTFGIPSLQGAEAQLIETPEVIDFNAALPTPGLSDDIYANDGPSVAGSTAGVIVQKKTITNTPNPFNNNNTNNNTNDNTTFTQTNVQSEFKAVLVGGLDYREGDLKIDQQAALFKQGFGNVNVKAFVYKTNAQTVLNFLSESAKLPIFLFSAGCKLAEALSKSNLVDKTNLFIIEPYAADGGTKTIVENAIKNGVPATNVYAGAGAPRGTGIAGASNTPSNINHWGSLKYVASQKASLAAKTYYKTKTQQGNNQGGGGPAVYTNVGKTAAGVPPGYEKFGVARTVTRKGASKADGVNGGIPYENLRKVNRSYTGPKGQAIYGSGYLHPEAAVGLELFLDFCAESGVLFEITPGGGWYRDYDNQIRLWDLYGPDRAAVPGHSNHGWGIAIDIRTLCNQTEAAAAQLGVSATNPKANAVVRNTDLYRFFATHAPKFGWYNPHLLCDNTGSDETWHWEYHGFSTLTTAQRNQMLKTFAETPRKSPLTKK